jgi:hypothetical protein
MSGVSDYVVSQDQRHRIGLDPERRENVAQWSSHDSRKAVWRSRNRGRKAIGFYEGSSAVEGTSGRHEPSAFTSRWSRRPWRLLHVGNDRETLHRARATDGRAKALPYFRGRGRRDRGVRGLVDSRRRGKKTPTLLSPYAGHGARGGQAKTGSACLATIRRSVLECRESTRSPGQAQEPKTLVPSTR